MNRFNFYILAIFIIFGFLLILGGLGIEVALVQNFGVFAGFLILLIVWVQKRSIKLPPSIILYSLFLVLFLLNIFVISSNVKKSLEVFSLFLGGGLFWIASYNLKKELSPYFARLIVTTGVIFAGLYFINLFIGDPARVKVWSLFLQSNAFRNHNHIGDLWAIVLIVVAFYIIKYPKKLFYWLLLLIGVYLIIISQARAAIVTFVVGLVFLTFKLNLLKKYKVYVIVAILLATALFLYLGTQKSVLLARPYYTQAVIGFINNPEGVGVGNFKVISENVDNHVLGLSGFSTVTHNIGLEILSGLGLMGIIFIVWLIRVLVKIGQSKKSKELVYEAIFFGLTASFFIDSTYFIPTMLWLWLLTLGLAQKYK